MPFPESERVVFRRNTLAEVICQLRFPPILEIAAKDPAAFQEQIRAEYPLYQRNQGPELPEQFQKIFPNVPGVLEGAAVTHKFTSEDEQTTISLARDFVAVSQTTYAQWERFRAEIERALTAMREVYQPAFYTRIGLRYVNVVNREELGLDADEPWPNLLSPVVTGPFGDETLADYISAASGEASIRVKDVEGGAVTLRYGLGEHDDAEGFIIDQDFYTTERSEENDILGVLNHFNRKIGNLFRWVIEGRLRNALDSEPME